MMVAVTHKTDAPRAEDQRLVIKNVRAGTLLDQDNFIEILMMMFRKSFLRITGFNGDREIS
jgi:hypothetical protein